MTCVDGTGSRFVVGDGYAFFEGAVPDGSVHRHAAFQVTIGSDGDVAVDDASGARHRAPVLVVPPMTGHRLLAAGALRIFYIEPHCAFADDLRALGGDGIIAAPALGGLREENVRSAVGRPSGDLDGRLLDAMDALLDGRTPLTEVAAKVGLSPQRLRALARAELGMPLARWRIWRRLARAAEAIREGLPLSGAAVAGGFSDQAHLTREMRRMMGITPAMAVGVLRASPPAGRVDGDRAHRR